MSKSKSMWFENQKKALLSKNSIQRPKTLKLETHSSGQDSEKSTAESKHTTEIQLKSITETSKDGEETTGSISPSPVPVDAQRVAPADGSGVATSSPPLDRQSTLGILLGQESVDDTTGNAVAASKGDNQVKHSNKERTGEEAAAESHSANTNRSSMKRGVSEFTMKDVEHRMSGQYKSARQHSTKKRRSSMGASTSAARSRASSMSSGMMRSLLYGNSRRMAREDPDTLVADRSVRRMKRQGATKQVRDQSKVQE